MNGSKRARNLLLPSKDLLQNETCFTMIDLLTHITQGITNNTDIEVSEDVVDGVHQYIVRAPKDVMGLLIGKEGRTIRAIRSLARARAIVEKININVNLEEQ